MANGYAGKILRVNLTNKSITSIETSKYEQWGGGAGIGAALFWDLCTDKTVNGYDPKNVVTVMTSPLGGTLAPSTSRTVIQGIGLLSYPKDWYTQTHIGGFFAAQLKYAGWDGIVIEGKADKPSWISIIDDNVTIRDATDDGDRLWGQLGFTAQQRIWNIMTQHHNYPGWLNSGKGATTQRPAVLVIGPAGENLSRIGTVNSGGGSGAGQGGFGGVFGGKNLKAIGALGTGSVSVADPAELMRIRLAFKKTQYNVDNPAKDDRVSAPSNTDPDFGTEYVPGHQVGCPSCFSPCRRRNANSAMDEQTCGATHWYITGSNNDAIYRSIDLVDQYGLNIADMSLDDSMQYLLKLYKDGIFGPGKQIDSDPLPMEEIMNGTMAGAEAYVRTIAYREGIGNDLAEGLMRASVKWGIADKELKTGRLCMPGYGLAYHHWLPNVYWAYATIMSDRDINETSVQNFPYAYIPVDEAVKRYTELLSPYNDPFMQDHSWQGADGSNMARAKETGVYSESKAKLVAWERHFEKFWMSSCLFCKSKYPQFFGGQPPEYKGFTPDLEVSLFNAVTGKNIKFTDGIELGRKIYNLNRAIWALQGRTREDEVFAEFMYRPGTGPGEVVPGRAEGQNATRKTSGVYDGTKWSYENVTDIFIDRDAFEEWKTKFYTLEGWDPKTGQPTRATLEGVGLKNVADTLQAAGKLGV